MARLPDPEIEWLKREISLERLVEAIAGGDEVSGRPGPGSSGNDRSLSIGLCQSHARLPAAGQEPEDSEAENRL